MDFGERRSAARAPGRGTISYLRKPRFHIYKILEIPKEVSHPNMAPTRFKPQAKEILGCPRIPEAVRAPGVLGQCSQRLLGCLGRAWDWINDPVDVSHSEYSINP